MCHCVVLVGGCAVPVFTNALQRYSTRHCLFFHVSLPASCKESFFLCDSSVGSRVYHEYIIPGESDTVVDVYRSLSSM